MIDLLRPIREASPERIQRAFQGRVSRLEDRAAREVIERLAAMRRDLAGQLASTDWEKWNIPRLQSAVERSMRQFAAEYEGILDGVAAEAWGLGEQALPDAVSAVAGEPVFFPSLDPATLTAAQNLNHTLITGVTEEANARILGEIKRGVMGDRPITDVMRRVGRNLTDEGAFKSIADRSEAIVRTETNAVYNMANHERDQQFADSAPDLGIEVWKEWMSARKPGRTRSAHWAAHGQTVPVDKPFVVGGEKMMFPLDPGASARNRVNCLCTYRRVFRKVA